MKQSTTVEVQGLKMSAQLGTAHAKKGWPHWLRPLLWKALRLIARVSAVEGLREIWDRLPPIFRTASR